MGYILSSVIQLQIRHKYLHTNKGVFLGVLSNNLYVRVPVAERVLAKNKELAEGAVEMD